MFPLRDRKIEGFPFWTIIIIAINVYVFYLELTAPNTDVFITQYSLIPVTVNFLQPSTLLQFFTSQFIHGGFIHIISNMWFLWIFGDNVENRLGFIFFPLFYLASGFLGNLVQYIFITNSTIPIIGASGAIAGILGAYYAFFPRQEVKTLIFILFFVTIIDVPAYLILFYWFITQLFSSAVSVSEAAINTGGVAYFAHIGGFGLGWILGKIITLRSANTLVNKTE